MQSITIKSFIKITNDFTYQLNNKQTHKIHTHLQTAASQRYDQSLQKSVPFPDPDNF